MDHGLIEGVISGDKRSVARAISAVEKGGEEVDALLDALYPHTGRAFRLGVTGPPGAGKSTLVARPTTHYRGRGQSVGIIAVDPTSPYTGGALLGDRIRMLDVAMDPEVFMRSMAARGALGGLSRAAPDAADVLDASGKDIVILETVGVGQSELDIAGAADATAVVLVPESGDFIQAMKSGLMEIADIFVVNKSDRPQSEQAAAAISRLLSFRNPHDVSRWIPPIVKTVASDDMGTVELADAIDAYRAHQRDTKGQAAKREAQARDRVCDIVDDTRGNEFWTAAKRAELMAGVPVVAARRSSPFALATQLMRR